MSEKPFFYFKSSGTTAQKNAGQTSRHGVLNEAKYQAGALYLFEKEYGSVNSYSFYFLLPGYIERGNSSLISMAKAFGEASQNHFAFYLEDFEALDSDLSNQPSDKTPFILGVTHALLRWAASRNDKLPAKSIVMETGGMKGHGPELIREVVHQTLCDALGVQQIHSEYGMTELSSQAYAKADGLFEPNESLIALVRDSSDPFTYLPSGRAGGLNMIDLGNRHSCAFIQADDIGRLHIDGSFEVLGRLDYADMRGCNLLAM